MGYRFALWMLFCFSFTLKALSGSDTDPETKIQSPGVIGIYLCTRDLEELSSISVGEKARKVNQVEGNCEPYLAQHCLFPDVADFVPFEEAGDCHYIFRHCFLLRATSNGMVDTVQGRQLLLTPLRALGFAGDALEKGKAVMYEEDLSRHENEVISCRLVFDETKVTENDLIKYYPTSKRAVVAHKWVIIENTIENEVLKGYNPLTRNCCTIAFLALEKIVPNLKEIVDPNNINFGIGTQFISLPKLACDLSRYGCRKFKKILRFW